jgi:hypothetical protein
MYANYEIVIRQKHIWCINLLTGIINSISVYLTALFQLLG